MVHDRWMDRRTDRKSDIQRLVPHLKYLFNKYTALNIIRAHAQAYLST